MQIEYALKDTIGNYIHRDITGKFGLTTSEILADRYDSRKTAKNVLDNCLPRQMRKGFEIVELVSSGVVLKDAPIAEPEPQKIKPKVEEALKIANEPIIENKIGEFAESFNKVKEILTQAAERKEELLDALSKVDSELSDINHYIELADDLNAYQGYLAYRMLRQKLRQRREIKNEINVIQSILNSEISRVEFDRISKCISGMDSRRYEPRVLTELFI